MTFFPEPIKPPEKIKEEEIRVSPVESEQKEKEKRIAEEKKAKSLFYGNVLVFLKKLTTLFARNKEQEIITSSHEELIKSVEMIKKLLQSLQECDQSENAYFCQNLSDSWNELLKQVDAISKAKTYIDTNKIGAFITEMNHYPPDEEHNLGFYLSHFAGEKWLPRPFMEILKKLYADYRENGETSTLRKWIEFLD